MKIDSLTVAEINLSNIEHNIASIRGLIGSKVKFMAVVKADAYGHGSQGIAKALDTADYLSVATVAEALEIRTVASKKPILVLSETSAANAKLVVENDLIQTVYTEKLAVALSDTANSLKKRSKVHLKVDTGMGRVGATINDAPSLFNKIASLSGIKVEGIFTHLAKAEVKNGFTREQLDRFNSVLSNIKLNGAIRHAANSAATMYHKASHLDMVRVGLSMYGLYPAGGDKDGLDLKPALEFNTRVVYLKNVPVGTPISYGSTYVTSKPTSIVTLPVGYADGLPRLLSNKGHVLIRGKKYPIVGRICMDMTLVDVGSDDISIGDEVKLIGTQGNGVISADDVASLAGTINYEIICGIGKRVPRIYKR